MNYPTNKERWRQDLTSQDIDRSHAVFPQCCETDLTARFRVAEDNFQAETQEDFKVYY